MDHLVDILGVHRTKQPLVEVCSLQLPKTESALRNPQPPSPSRQCFLENSLYCTQRDVKSVACRSPVSVHLLVCVGVAVVSRLASVKI